MPRVAAYDCRCCGGRPLRRLQPRRRAPKTAVCKGGCQRCGGPCRGRAHQAIIYRIEDPPAPALLRRPVTGELGIRVFRRAPRRRGRLAVWQA